jgi:hypothetical protein
LSSDGKTPQGKTTLEGPTKMLRTQLARLDMKAIELEKLRVYVRAKIDWQERGEKGPEPTLELSR